MFQLPRQLQAFSKQRRCSLVVVLGQRYKGNVQETHDDAVGIPCRTVHLQTLRTEFYRPFQISLRECYPPL